MKHRRRVCDLRELPDVPALKRWAAEHGADVHCLGPDLESRAVYGAAVGPVIRVARSRHREPHPHAPVWHSPLEHLPNTASAV
ncbi:hypothetical protein BJF83_18715 [Nocardiopsis sp. CNR-923]|uniref:hypothetical protein n=1 Tax=Nocardiopsis sp. CNR-923 TaxID=1904965 RepID=UPI00095FD647|nr:hypothetical protein [Nocardiopsis sp. CNR-923]OLT27218.1 hypothetical protein BJF83_18715 [Nocardiopsis sp. CNR-923]